VELSEAIQTALDFPYCDRGGPGVHAYNAGCNATPTQDPAIKPRQVGGRFLGSNYDPPGAAFKTREACVAALDKFDCLKGEGAKTLAEACQWAQRFDEQNDPGKMIVYTMQTDGVCCEPINRGTIGSQQFTASPW
jgi:hypothetical protein